MSLSHLERWKWIILTLLEVESEDTEDILGAGYWAQQPVWDTARSAPTLSLSLASSILPCPPPTSGLDSGLQKCITIYNNFFFFPNNNSPKKTFKFSNLKLWVLIMAQTLSVLSGHHIVTRRKGPRHIPQPNCCPDNNYVLTWSQQPIIHPVFSFRCSQSPHNHLHQNFTEISTKVLGEYESFKFWENLHTAR